jgi:hypothetical protein
LNTELARRLPSGKLMAIMMTSYQPEMSKEILEASGLIETLEEMKGKIPFDVTLLTSSFKNNAMIAVMKNEKPSPDDKMKGFEVYFAIPIADKQKFEKLKNQVRHFTDSLRKDEEGSKIFKGFKPFFRNNDELFVMAFTEDAATQFLNNPRDAQGPVWLEQYTQHPMVMSIDMGEFMRTMMSMAPGERLGDAEKGIFKKFSKIVFYGGEFEGSSVNSTMELTFTDANENSLKQLFGIFNEITSMNNLRRVEVTQPEIYDSRIPPPPPIDNPRPKSKTKDN